MRRARSSFFPLRTGRLTGGRLAVGEVRSYRFRGLWRQVTILRRTGNAGVTLGLPNLALLSDTYWASRFHPRYSSINHHI